jgi:hypothetical protein
MDEPGSSRSPEDAFESFAVMLWQMAQSQDSISAWARTCEHLYSVRLFLDRMRLAHLADAASDLMALAGCRVELVTPGGAWADAQPAARERRSYR